MADEDPIRQLQHLLDDPSHLLERISRIQSVIGSIGESSPAAVPAKTSVPVIEKPIDQDPAPFENLLRMLRDVQVQIDGRVRPLALEALGIESERLRQLARQEQAALDECLARLDRRLIDCVGRIDESRKIHGELAALNRRLNELGASPEPCDDFLSDQNSSTILQNRIEELHRQGKL